MMGINRLGGEVDGTEERKWEGKWQSLITREVGR
jgi:hypothetical protein